MIKVDTTSLNEFFNIEGDDYMMMSEEDLQTIPSPRDFGPGKWNSESRHTEESKRLIGSYHKGKVVSDETRRRISESQKGVPSPNRGAVGKNNVRSTRWVITHKCGKITDMVGISNWCKENGYNPSCVGEIASGKRKTHKDIVKVVKYE